MKDDEMFKERKLILEKVKELGLKELDRNELENLAAIWHIELMYSNEFVMLATEQASQQAESTKKLLSDLRGLKASGKVLGMIGYAHSIGKAHQKTDFATENGKKGAAKRPATIALNKIDIEEYPLHKHLFHLTGRIAEFVTNMHKKYPVIKNASSIERRISKLNKANGIKQK